MTDSSSDNTELVAPEPEAPATEAPIVLADRLAMGQSDMALEEASRDLRVRLPVFEGPLDLLLYLIKKDELDIYDIPIERITRQYLDYLQLMKMLDLEVAGEFLVVASTLVYIKSRTLLPKDLQPPEEDAEEDDPRWDLIRQLVEYKKFKDAAWHLHLKQLEQEKTYQRGAEVVLPERAAGGTTVGDVGIFDLINAFQKVLARVNQREDLKEIFEERFTVSDKINTIQQMMAGKERIFFEDLFVGVASKTEIVVTFLALLELIRLKFLAVIQPDPFAEIEISHATNSTPLFQKSAPGTEPSEPAYVGEAVIAESETAPETEVELDGEGEPSALADKEPVSEDEAEPEGEDVAAELTSSEPEVPEEAVAESASEPEPTPETVLEPVDTEVAPVEEEVVIVDDTVPDEPNPADPLEDNEGSLPEESQDPAPDDVAAEPDSETGETPDKDAPQP